MLTTICRRGAAEGALPCVRGRFLAVGYANATSNSIAGCVLPPSL